MAQVRAALKEVNQRNRDLGAGGAGIWRIGDVGDGKNRSRLGDGESEVRSPFGDLLGVAKGVNEGKPSKQIESIFLEQKT